MGKARWAWSWLLHSPSRIRRTVSLALGDEVRQSSPIPELSSLVGDEPVLLPPGKVLEWGNQGFGGLHYLVSLARTIGARNILEIGTFNGATAWCLAANLPEATVHTLDLQPSNEPALDLDERDLAFRRDFDVLVYDHLPHDGRVIQHWSDSATFDFSVIGECDLIFIDGAHSFEYVRSDTRNAMQVCTPRGAIVWDNYSHRWPGNVRFLNELSAVHCLYRVPGTELVALLPTELR